MRQEPKNLATSVELATSENYASMVQSLCLSKEELRELTGRTYGRRQIMALVSMGIRFRVRPDGTPAVLRSDLSADDPAPKKGERRIGPRLDLV